jgi:hypothetical protein
VCVCVCVCVCVRFQVFGFTGFIIISIQSYHKLQQISKVRNSHCNNKIMGVIIMCIIVERHWIASLLELLHKKTANI